MKVTVKDRFDPNSVAAKVAEKIMNSDIIQKTLDDCMKDKSVYEAYSQVFMETILYGRPSEHAQSVLDGKLINYIKTHTGPKPVSGDDK
jgi:hypothetical protein